MDNNLNKKLIIRPRRAALGKTAVVSVRLSEDTIKRAAAGKVLPVCGLMPRFSISAAHRIPFQESTH